MWVCGYDEVASSMEPAVLCLSPDVLDHAAVELCLGSLNLVAGGHVSSVYTSVMQGLFGASPS